MLLLPDTRRQSFVVARSVTLSPINQDAMKRGARSTAKKNGDSVCGTQWVWRIPVELLTLIISADCIF